MGLQHRPLARSPVVERRSRFTSAGQPTHPPTGSACAAGHDLLVKHWQAPSSLPGRPAAGGPTQLQDPQAARDRHEQDPGDRRKQQGHPEGEHAVKGEEGDLHGIVVLQDKDQQEQQDQPARTGSGRPTGRPCGSAGLPLAPPERGSAAAWYRGPGPAANRAVRRCCVSAARRGAHPPRHQSCPGTSSLAEMQGESRDHWPGARSAHVPVLAYDVSVTHQCAARTPPSRRHRNWGTAGSARERRGWAMTPKVCPQSGGDRVGTRPARPSIKAMMRWAATARGRLLRDARRAHGDDVRDGHGDRDKSGIG